MNAEDLRLRNDLVGALTAGGHYHGGDNHAIIGTVTMLCNRVRAMDAENEGLRAREAEIERGIQSILDLLGDEASDDCGALLRIERAVGRLVAERMADAL